MNKYFFSLLLILSTSCIFAQTTNQSLTKAFETFNKDPQLRYASTSLYVIDAETGKPVFDKNSLVGLAPASTQKIITSVTAFEILGADFHYETELGYIGKLAKDSLDGYLYIKTSGDPTFGSWRYSSSKPNNIIDQFTDAIRKKGIRKLSPKFYIDNNNYDPVPIPDGWIWQDIGNYYGAAAQSLNWRENQFDLVLRSSDKIGSPVEVLSINGEQDHGMKLNNELVAAAAGTGDNAYLYLPITDAGYTLKGTIPVNEKSFKISGASAEPAVDFMSELSADLRKENMFDAGALNRLNAIDQGSANSTTIYTHRSVALDSIIYWFNKKSINLYGEALLRTLAKETSGVARTDSGVNIIKRFWKQRNIDPEELNMSDGSGLSPLNRVTTHAQVQILRFASTRKWFRSFYDALPDYNGMHMKSGTISDVKGFCGYHTAANGKKYIFSFLVNNYTGSSSTLVAKMYKVLDVLK